MKTTLMRVAMVVASMAMTAAWADPAPRVLYDDVRNTHHPITVTTSTGTTTTTSNNNNNNRSGLGDGTNPGNGSGNNNSGNTGTNNPGGSRR